MIRVAVPDDCPPVLAPSQAWKALRERAEVVYHDSLPGSPERLVERIADAEAVFNIRASSLFTDVVLAACPRLRLISIWGTGTDNVDLAAAARCGITVTNTPAVSAISVAEHTLALMLAAARRIPQVDAATRRGEWPRGRATQLHGKTLGVIGLGAIGTQMARLGQGIGMRVLTCGLTPRPGGVPLGQLLAESHVVSLHLRLSERTRGFLGARELALMRPGAILVNTARGALVDEAALVEGLRARRISAALDVFASEPLPASHPFVALDNVVLTPHSAGITHEALEAGLQMAVDNIWDFFAGKARNMVSEPK